VFLDALHRSVERVQPAVPLSAVGHAAHLVIVTGNLPWLDGYSPALETASTALLPGEIIPIEQFYFAPPPPPVPLRPGQFGVGIFMHNSRQVCTSCRFSNPEIARLRYALVPNCYLPPDYEGDNSEPCGTTPQTIYVEGAATGQAIIGASIRKDGEEVAGKTLDFGSADGGPACGSIRNARRLRNGR
jgi:hypothetical protein